MSRCRTVALLAREWGADVLEYALLDNEEIEVVQIFTHGKKPNAEGGAERGELARYRKLALDRDIPLVVLDHPEARAPENQLSANSLDLMVSLSWRSIVQPRMLARFRRACINIHRGALPEYAGAEPVRQAIEAGEKRVAITAHHMVEAVDKGPEIARCWLEIDPAPGNLTPAAHAEEIKRNLRPLYVPLTRLAIKTVCAGDGAA